jgi:Spy/CpxP family protein refolding chaperone
MGGPGLNLPPPEALERLNLSDAQRAKVDSLVDTERRKDIRTEADLRIAEMDLQKLVESDRPQAEAVDAAIGRLVEARTTMLRDRVAAIIELRALLTADQRAKLRRPERDARWH